MIDITQCPECGEPAEIQWRDVLESTDGPVEHAKVMCLHRHWFLLPVTMLEQCTTAPEAVTGETIPHPSHTPRNLAV